MPRPMMIEYNGTDPEWTGQVRPRKEWAKLFSTLPDTISKRARENRPIDVDARFTPSPFSDGA